MMLRSLVDKGLEQASCLEEADIYVLNTCTITSQADAKARKLLKRARRVNPNLRIIATGCYVERRASDLTLLTDLLVANNQKQDMANYFKNSVYIGDNNKLYLRKTRDFVKIQAGCEGRCSYCIVPLIRPVENVPPDEVISQIKMRENEGYKEIVLTGSEIGAYNYSGVTLKGLLKRILEETQIDRLRLSSLQPGELDEELLDYWQNERLCRHFHLSLQSGSNSVLRRMRRQYTTDDFARIVSLIRSRIPGVALSTDVIVGFPGENDEEFWQSYEFCQRIGFSRMHIFPFSHRPGTAASEMPGKTDEKIKRRRVGIMLELALQSRHNFLTKSVGKLCRVLVEQKTGDYWSGLTDNYLRVYFMSGTGEDLTNRIVAVNTAGLFKDGLSGEILP